MNSCYKLKKNKNTNPFSFLELWPFRKICDMNSLFWQLVYTFIHSTSFSKSATTSLIYKSSKSFLVGLTPHWRTLSLNNFTEYRQTWALTSSFCVLCSLCEHAALWWRSLNWGQHHEYFTAILSVILYYLQTWAWSSISV